MIKFPSHKQEETWKKEILGDYTTSWKYPKIHRYNQLNSIYSQVLSKAYLVCPAKVINDNQESRIRVNISSYTFSSTKQGFNQHKRLNIKEKPQVFVGMRSLPINQVPASKGDWFAPSRHRYSPRTTPFQTLAQIFVCLLSPKITNKPLGKSRVLTRLVQANPIVDYWRISLTSFLNPAEGVSELHLKNGTSGQKVPFLQIHTQPHEESTRS